MSADNLGSNKNPAPYVLFFAMLTIGMGQTVIYAVMPALGRELALDQIIVNLPLGLGDWEPGKMAITSISAMTALIFAFVAPFWGRRSDRIGRKPVIILGLVGYTIGTVAFNSVAHFGLQGVIGGVLLWCLLLAARILHATVMSATFPASSAYMIDITDVRTRASGLGKIGAANQLGVLLGPALAGIVVYGFLTPLYVQATMTFVAATLVYFFLRESLPKSTISESQLSGQSSRQKKLSLFDRRFLFILPVGFLLHIMQGMAQQTLGFYCEDIVGLARIESVKYYALAMMASSIAMLLTQLTVVQRVQWAPQTLMKVGLPFCAAGYAAIAVTSQIYGVFLGMAIFGVGIGLCMPGYSTFASLTVRAEEQGNMAGINGTVAGLGFVVGPLLGGYIYNFSENAPYVIAATSIALLAVYVAINRRFRVLGAQADLD